MKVIDDITNFIFVEDEPHKVDAIFIPGTSLADPAEKAAELWNKGYSNYIIPSGKYSSKLGYFPSDKTKDTSYERDYETECDFFCEVLYKNNVPKEIVIKEKSSQNTYENAYKSKELVESSNINLKKAIVCCQSYHARRVLMTYSWVYPNTQFYICPVDTRGITKDNWFTFEYGINRVMGELARCGHYFPDMIKEIYEKELKDK
ncbi:MULTISPECIES: YdcF family protein [Clostridium]|uniref:YdcF family protein n=1 Tax=Clostridium TaxID=1485 RepID=UPI00082547BB|nr:MULTISPECIES: YdcF family protein [Clostridium]PJI10198.1 YdcF family protein [Clostridium sp. CT7]